MDGETTETTVGFVLVHGAELGAWLWERVTPLLQRPSVAADLPGRGPRPGPGRTVTLDTAVESLVEDVRCCGTDRVVLVAHSFSGVLVPPVVDRVAEPPRLLLDKVSPAALPEFMPRHYVRLGQDRSITDAARDRSIHRLEDVTVHDLDSGHLPMLSQPAALAALLEDIASSCQDGAVP